MRGDYKNRFEANRGHRGSAGRCSCRSLAAAISLALALLEIAPAWAQTGNKASGTPAKQAMPATRSARFFLHGPPAGSAVLTRVWRHLTATPTRTPYAEVEVLGELRALDKGVTATCILQRGGKDITEVPAPRAKAKSFGRSITVSVSADGRRRTRSDLLSERALVFVIQPPPDHAAEACAVEVQWPAGELTDGVLAILVAGRLTLSDSAGKPIVRVRFLGPDDLQPLIDREEAGIARLRAQGIKDGEELERLRNHLLSEAKDSERAAEEGRLFGSALQQRLLELQAGVQVLREHAAAFDLLRKQIASDDARLTAIKGDQAATDLLTAALRRMGEPS